MSLLLYVRQILRLPCKLFGLITGEQAHSAGACIYDAVYRKEFCGLRGYQQLDYTASNGLLVYDKLKRIWKETVVA
jgi:hypothetical protein